eukprot:TRINITY_DN27558_c0_g1_i1.p1 TRINITY_DN27558_c0_g1~~TRINITY_DN27558_c0_g1_i1.p1  ORF type:complete len:495 (+),score=29.99 TRINITY_DN27558_c0_g1_i1:31-1485(+)
MLAFGFVYYCWLADLMLLGHLQLVAGRRQPAPRYKVCDRDRRKHVFRHPYSMNVYIVAATWAKGVFRASFRLENNASDGQRAHISELVSGVKPWIIGSNNQSALRKYARNYVNCGNDFQKTWPPRKLGMVRCFAGSSVVPANFQRLEGLVTVNCSLPDHPYRSDSGQWQATFKVHVMFGMVFSCFTVSDCQRFIRTWGYPEADGADFLTVDMDMQVRIRMRPASPASRFWTVCSQPLYGFGAMAKHYPRFFHDWVAYHLGIGIDHFFIYDSDGSFANAVKPFVKRGAVSYFGKYGSRLGNSMSDPRAPLCAEFFAYTHCLVENFDVSTYVQLLHGPDEYLRPDTQHNLMARLATQLYSSKEDPYIWSVHLPLARDANCEGSPIDCSILSGGPQAFDLERTSPFLRPELCLIATAERCYWTDISGFKPKRFPAKIVQLFHYVEFLPRDAGRCSRIMRRTCNHPEAAARDLALKIPWYRNLARGIS